MGITKKEAIKLRALIRAYRQSQINLSWLGGCHPDDHDEVTEEATINKHNLHSFITSITEN